MTGLGQIVVVALLAPLVYLLFTNRYERALYYGIFLLVSQSRFLLFRLPGAVPNLTIHRLVFICLVLGWICQPGLGERLRRVPYRRVFNLWFVVGLISLAGSVNLQLSIKTYLSFVLQVYVLYLMLSTSISTFEQTMSIVRSIFLGLALVAVIAFTERTFQMNPLVWLNPEITSLVSAHDVVSTMDHRILMGTAMAMGWPLGMALLQIEPLRSRSKLLIWLGILLLIMCCYFSMSRGPWVATFLAGVGLAVLLPKGARTPLYTVLVCVLLALLLRPGILDTLTVRAEHTFSEDTLKHSTFMYRFELWKISFAGISDSMWKILFGNGPGLASDAAFDWTLSYSGSDMTISSWDNHYAALMYNTGIVGLLAMILLQAFVLLGLLRMQREFQGEKRAVWTCVLASAGTYIFMMTNVFIFAPQLSYVFWALIGACMGNWRRSASDLPRASEDANDKALQRGAPLDVDPLRC